MNRLMLALHVLLGRPLVYRANFIAPFRLAPNDRLWVIDITVIHRKDERERSLSTNNYTR